MKQPLKQSLQQHLNQQCLSTRQLQQLHAIQQTQPRKKSILNDAWFKQSIVASLLFLLISSLFILSPTYFSTQSIEQLIAEEVVGNHLKLKPLEVSTDTLGDIKKYFKHLNFLPISPAFLTSSKQSLIGGRYCSIQGATAVQLRLVNNITGQVQSLYETEYDKNIFKNFSVLADAKKPVTIYANGMKVHIWVEKDILFALTE